MDKTESDGRERPTLSDEELLRKLQGPEVVGVVENLLVARGFSLGDAIMVVSGLIAGQLSREFDWAVCADAALRIGEAIENELDIICSQKTLEQQAAQADHDLVEREFAVVFRAPRSFARVNATSVKEAERVFREEKKDGRGLWRYDLQPVQVIAVREKTERE